MLQSLTRAVGQSFDPAFRRVFFRSFMASFATYILVWLGSWLLFGWLGGLLEGWFETVDLWEWLETSLIFLFKAGGFATLIIASLFVFPAIMVAIMSLFLEEIAEAVEAEHYPNLGEARKPSISENIRSGLAFAAVTLGLNILVLPFYLIPIINIVVFIALNGYLLGREYFELVGLRRSTPGDTKKLRNQRSGRVLTAGAIIAFLFAIPLVNLAAPIIATAFMLHIFEGVRQKA
ncbi:MAG: EI24 domain-containing protein [Kiloniellales bacterium]|nr:EI24 domain-containing protein [Kiloniellales bacterium]